MNVDLQVIVQVGRFGEEVEMIVELFDLLFRRLIVGRRVSANVQIDPPEAWLSHLDEHRIQVHIQSVIADQRMQPFELVQLSSSVFIDAQAANSLLIDYIHIVHRSFT